MSGGYRELAPPPILAPFVECFWTHRAAADEGPSRVRVLPDGCIDILIDLEAQADPRVVGAMTRAQVIETSSAIDLLAVRFRPGGAAAILGLPAHELTDRTVPLADLAPSLAWHPVVDAPPAQRIERWMTSLAERARERTVDPRVAAARRRLDRGGVSIDHVASELNVTRQHLSRLFRSQVGFGPKQLQRIYRLQAALVMLEKRPTDLVGVALASGYADQPHFCLDCRELAGVSPTEWLRERD